MLGGPHDMLCQCSESSLDIDEKLGLVSLNRCRRAALALRREPPDLYGLD